VNNYEFARTYLEGPFSINSLIAGMIINLQSNGMNNLILVDAYDAFKGSEGNYLLLGDVHPNIKGQKVLAKIGSEAFQSLVKERKK